MLTEQQSELLRKVIDLNWEASFNEDPAIRDLSETQLFEAKHELIRSMGLEAYCKFMQAGREMFAPRE